MEKVELCGKRRKKTITNLFSFVKKMQKSFHALARVASLEGIFDFDIYEQSLLNIKAPSNYL